MKEKLKRHWDKNKKLYLGVGLGIGAAIGVGVALTKVKTGPGGLQQAIIVGPWATNNQAIIELVERSTPSKPVHLVGTNLYFNSLSEAARETGHSLARISSHVNGHIKDLNGDVFEVLSPAS